MDTSALTLDSRAGEQVDNSQIDSSSEFGQDELEVTTEDSAEAFLVRCIQNVFGFCDVTMLEKARSFLLSNDILKARDLKSVARNVTLEEWKAFGLPVDLLSEIRANV